MRAINTNDFSEEKAELKLIWVNHLYAEETTRFLVCLWLSEIWKEEAVSNRAISLCGHVDCQSCRQQAWAKRGGRKPGLKALSRWKIVPVDVANWQRYAVRRWPINRPSSNLALTSKAPSINWVGRGNEKGTRFTCADSQSCFWDQEVDTDGKSKGIF